MQHSTLYTLIFALVVCVVCGLMVSSAAVSLLDRQKYNAELDRQRNVLEAAGLVEPGEAVSAEEIARRFERVEPVAVHLETGEEDPSFDLTGYDQIKAAADPARSRPAPPNASAIKRLPIHAQVYKVKNEAGEVEMLVLPIQGLGLWGTLYGFLALDADGETVRGMTFYQHKETPGLGGEVDNPRWKALWPGRKVYGRGGEVEIEVIKGSAGPPSEDPHRIDGLSGATITSRGVTNMLHFWLGPDGFGPYLENSREEV